MEYLFTNNTRVKLDDRGRFAVAVVDFDQLRHGNEAADVYIALGKENQLEIWPADAFRAKAAIMKEKAQSDSRWMTSLRRMMANAKPAQVDKQRRVALPVELRNSARMEASTEVIVNGFFDHIEVWLPEAFLASTEEAEFDL
jgi:division/cell wall cluster transcriptional repressor MraZ